VGLACLETNPLGKTLEQGFLPLAAAVPLPYGAVPLPYGAPVLTGTGTTDAVLTTTTTELVPLPAAWLTPPGLEAPPEGAAPVGDAVTVTVERAVVTVTVTATQDPDAAPPLLPLPEPAEPEADATPEGAALF